MTTSKDKRIDFYDCFRALQMIQGSSGLAPEARDQEIKSFYSGIFKSNGWLDEFGAITWNAHVAMDRMEEFDEAFGCLYDSVDHHLFTKAALKVLNLRADMSMLRAMQMICTVMPALKALSESGKITLSPQSVSASLSIPDLMMLHADACIPEAVRSRIACYIRSLPGATDWAPDQELPASAEEMHNQIASQVAQILLMME